MKNKFDSIVAFLSETDWNAHYTLTFADVCHCFGVDSSFVDNLMYEAFGMSGDEIVEQYRKNLPLIC